MTDTDDEYSGDILDRLRDKIIADAFEKGQIQSGKLAERLIVERNDAIREIEKLRAAVGQEGPEK